MKTILIAIIIAVGLGALVHSMPSRTEIFVERNASGATTTAETMEVVEVMPDWAQDKDAVKAAQDVIRRKKLEAELVELTGQREQIDARMTEIEKELGTY